MHLAEFNFGTLRYDWDDPRVADFQNNLDRIYDLARRSPGYVWHLDEDDMEAAQLDPNGALGCNPRTASTLSVWTDAQSLRDFTFKTAHRQFLHRRDEWFEPRMRPGMVMWHVAVGHRPTVEEAMERFRHLEKHASTDHAFDWSFVSEGGNEGETKGSGSTTRAV